MRIPLAIRIFLAQLAFAVAVGAVAYGFVDTTFRNYFESWKSRLETFPAEAVWSPLAHEVGRSLLIQEGKIEEARDLNRERIVAGLESFLRGIPSIQSMLVVDSENRILFSNDRAAVDLAFRDPEMLDFLGGSEIRRRRLATGGAEALSQVMVPIFADPVGEGTPPRIGSVVVTFRNDPALSARLPEIAPPVVDPRQYAEPLIALLVLAGAGGLVVTLFALLPIRRLDRALKEFRRRGFRGGLDAATLGLDRSLTDTVHAINELGGRLEALDVRGREREALLATLSQTLEDGMLALDPDGEPVAWNAASVRLLCGAGSDRTDEASCLRAALDRHPALAERPEEGTLSREVAIVREDGTRAPVGVTVVAFEVKPGVPGSLLLLRDLASFRKVEEHLLEAGRFAVLAHLAGGLAHEIRNPLHSIGLNAGVVEQYVGAFGDGSPDGAVAESLRAIQDETRRLTDLLNNYLGMLRSGVEPGLIDVREICRRVLQLLAFAALKSRVDLRLDGDEDLPLVPGVPDRIQQAILNLVLNAIQAMPHGGTVILNTVEAGGHVRVTVSDTGPGVPEDVVPHLFETRLTTKPGGSGLGLPLVRLIAEAHGGSVSYRSRPGEGSAFTLVLPSTPRAA